MPRRRRSRPPCDAELPNFSDEDDDSCRSGGEKPQQRNAANARERARMRVLSKAFCRLKTTLPWVPADTKLSKLDTLRLATSYIAHLRAIMNEESPIHPLNLTWPFSFQQQQQQQQQHQHRDPEFQLREDSSSSCPDGIDEPSNPVPQHHSFLNSHHHQFSDSLLHIG